VKTVDSQALGEVNRALGITGRGAQRTELLDGQVVQTLDIGPIVRRGMTQGVTQGIYYAILRNIHVAADTRVTSVNPYNQTIGNLPPYPLLVPAGFDLWLLSAAVRQDSGSGTIAASLGILYPSTSQAFGEDSSGAAVEEQDEYPLCSWDAIVTVGISWAVLQQGGSWMRFALRLPRFNALELTFRSVSSAAVTWDCVLTLGLFPATLGQDALR